MKKLIAILTVTFLFLAAEDILAAQKADHDYQDDVTAFVSGDVISVRSEYETVDGEISVGYRIIPTAFTGYQ